MIVVNTAWNLYNFRGYYWLLWKCLLFVYPLLMLPYVLWRQKNKPGLWIFISFVIPFMVIQALVFVNIGTLYRMRYGFLMGLVAVGFSVILDMIAHRDVSISGNGVNSGRR